mgnify:CR=1 FL=1
MVCHPGNFYSIHYVYEIGKCPAPHIHVLERVHVTYLYLFIFQVFPEISRNTKYNACYQIIQIQRNLPTNHYHQY